MAAEFSAGFNGCGKFLGGVPPPGTPDPGVSSNNGGTNCSYWTDVTQWTDADKQGVAGFVLASMDALRNWFFWTWTVSRFKLYNERCINVSTFVIRLETIQRAMQ